VISVITGFLSVKDKTPKERKKKISDHLHLRAEFQINKLTRELEQMIHPEN
jgi:hypothetical protein